MDNPLRRPEGTLPPGVPSRAHSSRGHGSRDYASQSPAPRNPRSPTNLNDLEGQTNHTNKPGSSAAKTAQGHLVAMSGEFVGTTMFLFFGFGGTQIANTVIPPDQTDLGKLLYISLSFGFSLAVTAWVFYRVSGGLFNPAVTLGLMLGGALPWIRGGLLFPLQMLGGMTAAALVSCLFPGPLVVQSTLAHGTSIAQGVFIEMFLTAELVLTILFLAAEKTKATFIAPIGIGLALFVAELTGVYFTGGSLNPSRSFGPCVVNHSFPKYHWIYWIGPFLGAIISAGYYKFAKLLEYERANPGQDDSHHPDDLSNRNR